MRSNHIFISARNFTLPRDPLVLDLDGDGLELKPASGNILFDHDADGIKTGTGWASADDGFLVRDLNGNGLIDSGRELFGEDTLKRNGQLATQGFDALADLDTNADGHITNADAAWSELQVWRDLNQDGISQSNELSSLDALNITRIGVSGTSTGPQAGQTIQNNRVAFSATFTQGGVDRTIGAIDLDANPFFSAIPPEQLDEAGNPVTLTEAALALPQMNGSGMVRNLRAAVSQSGAAADELEAALAAFAAAPTRDQQRALLDTLITEWAQTSSYWSELESYLGGSVAVNPPVGMSKAEYRNLVAVLEAFNGSRFYGLEGQAMPVGQSASTANGATQHTITPPAAQAVLLQQAYGALKESVYNALVVQTRLKHYLDAIELRIDDSGLSFDTTAMAQLLEQRYTESASEAVDDLVDLMRHEGGSMRAVDFNATAMLRDWSDAWPIDSPLHARLTPLGVFTAGAIVGGMGDDIYLGNAGNNRFSGGDGNDILDGGAGDDELFGGKGSDVLLGGAGNDRLYGGNNSDSSDAGASDVLDGGAGDDFLQGGSGSQIYRFGRGDGRDVILNPFDADAIPGSQDVLQFKAGIAPSEVMLSRAGDHLLLKLKGSTDQVEVRYFFKWEGASQHGYKLDAIRFDDGTRWDWAQIKALVLQGTDDNDTITGYATHDTIDGGPGDDVLYGEAGNDTLDGGAGDDSIEGGDGDDVLRGGAGNDTLRGGTGMNILDGGRGNDVFVVSGAQDEIALSLGDGQDVVIAAWSTPSEEASAAVRIRLQGVSSHDAVHLTFGQAYLSSVYLAYGDQGDHIEFRNWNGSRTRWAQTVLVFDDSEERSLLDVMESQSGTDQDDVIHAPAFAVELRGGAGDDVFHAHSRDNVFEGGTGNDELNGTATYRFADGWGHDVLRPDSSGTTTLDFSGALASTDVVFSRFLEETRWSDWSPIRTQEMIRIESLKDGSTVVMPAYGPYRLVFSDTAIDAANGAGLSFNGNDALRHNMQWVRNDDFSVLAADGSHRVLDGQGGDDALDSRRWRRIAREQYLNEDGWWFDEDAYWLKGGDGNDTLYGTTGDILDGGRGNDLLVQHWRTGAETTIRLALGDGQDTWTSNYHFDSLDHSVFAFAADVDPGSVWAEWVRTASTVNAAHDLVLHYGDQGDRVTLVGVRPPEQRGREITARLRFADGTETLLHTTIAPAGITPETAGDDVILGTLGRDVIGSGEGNDRIVLDDGDTYVYRLGHGHDVIDTSRGSIQLADITDASRVKVERTSEGTLANTVNTWRITFSDREETLQVRFKGVEHVPQLLLGDGKPLPLRTLPQVGTEGYDSMTGGSGHDDLYGLGGGDGLVGGAGNDVLVGGRGNDTLRGGEGDDVYVYERGDGADWVDADDHVSSVDTLRFGAGILESDVSLVRQGYDLEVRLRGDGGSVWIREHFWPRGSDQTSDRKLDRIEFATGAVWDLPAIDALINTSATNLRPEFKGAIPLLKAQAGSTFSYTVPANTIVDPNPWDAVNYYAKMPDGSALPAWVSFDALTRTLTARPEAAHVGTLQFVLWGKDAFGYGTGQYVTLQVGAPAQPAAASAPEALAAAWPQAPAPTVADLGGAADVAPATGTSTPESVAAALPQKESLAAALPQEASAVPSATPTAAPSARILGPVDFEARNAALWRDFGDTVGLSAYDIQRQEAERAREAARWVTPAPLAAATAGSALERQAQINTQVDLMIQAMAAFGAPPPMGLGSYRAQHPQPGALFPPIAIGPN